MVVTVCRGKGVTLVQLQCGGDGVLREVSEVSSVIVWWQRCVEGRELR